MRSEQFSVHRTGTHTIRTLTHTRSLKRSSSRFPRVAKYRV